MRVIKTLRLFKFYRRWSLAEALKNLGEYEPDLDGGPGDVSEVANLFAGEVVGLEESVDVHLILVEYGEQMVTDFDVSQWMKDNGFEQMQLKHTIAIGLQYPDEQTQLDSIWALGSVRNRFVFVLGSEHICGQPIYIRRLFRVTRPGHFFGAGCIFGAVRASTK